MNNNANKNSPARLRANHKYDKKTYKPLTIRLKHIKMELLDKHCKKYGYSKNGFAIQAIEETIKRDEERYGKELINENEEC